MRAIVASSHRSVPIFRRGGAESAAFGRRDLFNPLHSKQDRHGLRFADEGTAPQVRGDGERAKQGSLMFAHVLDCEARSGRSEQVGSILLTYILRILQGQEGFVDFLGPSDATDHERFVCVSFSTSRKAAEEY